MEKIFNELLSERIAQDKKFGKATERNLSYLKWLAILMEEIGEIATALLNYDNINYREELIQSGAVIIAMLEVLNADMVKGPTT